MGRNKIDVRAASTAPPARIMALLTDGASWPCWSGHDSFELVEPAVGDGPGGREGVGAVRLFKKGYLASTERVIELTPDSRLGYELVSGLPLKDYRAYVDLTPRPDGRTDIHWYSSFVPKHPGTGWLYGLLLRNFIRRAARRLAATAAQ
jgi:Polyketide cyclase / dehydrase and lipid transport